MSIEWALRQITAVAVSVAGAIFVVTGANSGDGFAIVVGAVVLIGGALVGYVNWKETE